MYDTKTLCLILKMLWILFSTKTVHTSERPDKWISTELQKKTDLALNPELNFIWDEKVYENILQPVNTQTTLELFEKN